MTAILALLARWGLGERLASAWRWITASNVHLMLVIALAVGAWGWLGWDKAATLNGQLTKANATIARIAAAQKLAAADQAAVNRASATASKTIAETSHASLSRNLSASGELGAAYAAAHPVDRVCKQAPRSAARDAGVPGAAHTSALDDGSGADGLMVAIPRADFDTCTAVNTRLTQVHTDAQALIAVGVAVPAP